MRDGLWYHELCHAIIDGDIGCVSEIIKVSGWDLNFVETLF